MKRLTMPCLLALLSVSMAVPACAGAYEKCIKPVTSQITWTGSGTELADVIAQFLLCDGGSAALAPACALADLEDLAASLGPGGAQVVNCLLKYHAENGTPKVRERARAVGAKRGVIMGALKCDGDGDGKVVLRSPGEARPPVPPVAQLAGDLYFPEPGNVLHLQSLERYEVPSITIGCATCDQGTHQALVAFPGAMCVRDGMSWADVGREVRKYCAGMHGCDLQASRGTEPLLDAISDSLIEWAHAEVKPTSPAERPL